MRTPLSRLLAFSVAGITALTAFSDDAFADRRSSLAGNMLILDQDDIYIYPQLTLEHRNLVSFDYFPGNSLTGLLSSGAPEVSGQSGNQGGGDPNELGQRSEDASSIPNGPATMGGSALLLFGQESAALGISTHRQDWYGSSPASFLGMGDLQLYGPANQQAWGFLGYSGPVPGAQTVPSATPTPNSAPSVASQVNGVFLQPLPLVDLLAGFSLGGGNSLGVRLSGGQNTFREERLGAGVEDFELWNTTVLDLLVGFSMRGDFDLDIGAEFGLAFFSNRYETSEQEPNYNDSASLAPSFSLTGRGITELQESISLAFLGILHVNTSSFTSDHGVSDNNPTSSLESQFSSTNVFLEAGAGPLYELPNDTTIAAYGTVGFGNSSYRDELRNFSTSALLLPGFKLALEHWMLDWLAFRTGVSSRYYFAFQSRSFDDDVTPNVPASSTFYEFLWSAGLGVALGNFELNGTFQTPFVTSGPAFVSGTSPGLWGLLNASYKF